MNCEVLELIAFRERLPLIVKFPRVTFELNIASPPTYIRFAILTPPLTINEPVLESILVVSLLLDITIGKVELNVLESYVNSGIDASLLALL